MNEIVSENERIAFWDEVSKNDNGFLKGKRLLIMSSGSKDAVIGNEAASRLQKLGADVLVGGSSDWFMYGGANGEYAYVKAMEDVDAVVMVSPIQNPDDNGMIRAMREVASKALAYEDTKDLLPGETKKVAISGASKIAVINPRKNSPSMSFLSGVAGGKHEIGTNQSGLQLLEGVKAIIKR